MIRIFSKGFCKKPIMFNIGNKKQEDKIERGENNQNSKNRQNNQNDKRGFKDRENKNQQANSNNQFRMKPSPFNNTSNQNNNQAKVNKKVIPQMLKLGDSKGSLLFERSVSRGRNQDLVKNIYNRYLKLKDSSFQFSQRKSLEDRINMILVNLQEDNNKFKEDDSMSIQNPFNLQIDVIKINSLRSNSVKLSAVEFVKIIKSTGMYSIGSLVNKDQQIADERRVSQCLEILIANNCYSEVRILI